MKNIFKFIGIIAFIAVAGLTLMANKPWDKSTPKDQRVTLYFTDDVRVTKVDGVEKKMGPVAVAYRGMSSSHRTNNPKSSLIIPAGERTLTMEYSYLKNWIEIDIKFNFVAGRHYRIDLMEDYKLGQDVTTMREAGRASAAAVTGKMPLVYNVVDITNAKGKPEKKKAREHTTAEYEQYLNQPPK